MKTIYVKDKKMFAPMSFMHSDCDEIWFRNRLDYGEEDRLHFFTKKFK